MQIKQIRKKLAVLLLAVMMIAGFIPAMTMTAHAATPEQLKATIEAYGGGGLTATVDISTVTVTGSVTGATTGLTLNIDAGVTVVWKATLSGSTTGTSSNGIINPIGNGAFELAEGGKIEQLGTGAAMIVNTASYSLTLNVTGGTLSAKSGNGFWANYSRHTINVSGGEIRSETGSAIVNGGALNVSGGTVTNGGSSNTIYSGVTNVNVSGTGRIENTGSGSAIYNVTNLTVEGGGAVVSATGYAINGASNVTVSGGLVSGGNANGAISSGNNAYVSISGGKVINTGAGYAISLGNNGLCYVSGGEVITGRADGAKYSTGSTAVAIEQAASTTGNLYTAGTSVDLTVFPAATASAVWDIDGGRHGIRYARSANAGFIEATGITVSTEGVEALYVNDPGETAPYISVSTAQTAITNALAISDTVVVTGKLTGVVSTLTLAIPSGKTVVWEAELSGSTSLNTSTPIVSITGTGGVFEAAPGGSVIQTGAGIAINIGAANTVINITGGSVSSLTSSAINANVTNITVNISGGSVSATTGTAILASYGATTVNVSGGLISATTGYAINNRSDGTVSISGGTITGAGLYTVVAGSNSVVTVSGAGEVYNTGSGSVINNNSVVNVSGGKIIANTGIAIYGNNVNIGGGFVSSANNNQSSGTLYVSERLTITGGTVEATAANGYASYVYGSSGVAYVTGGTVSVARTDGVKYTTSGNAVIIEQAVTTTGNRYTAGTSDDLTFFPAATASVVWDTDGERHGIRYARGTNTGFIEVPGVTVIAEGAEALYVNDPGETTPYTNITTAQAAITNALAAGDTAVVTGKLTGVVNTLTLAIPSGKTVVWEAELSGSTAYNVNTPIILVTGTGGVLEVASGGSVIQTGAGYAICSNTANTAINVTGGSVSATSGYGIYAAGNNTTVSVSAGTVTATGGNATIYSTANASPAVSVSGTGVVENTGAGNAVFAMYHVDINGGEVRANTSYALYISGNNGSVSISGGLVTSAGTAIYHPSSPHGVRIVITGGMVESTGASGYAVAYTSTDNSQGVTFVNGGEVKVARADGVKYGMNINANGGIAIERSGFTISYTEGSSDELAVTGNNASAVWAMEDGLHGIRYQRGTNTGFFEVPGVTVTAHEHEWDEGTVTKPATCEDDGVMTFACLHCDETYTEVIPATGHNYLRVVTDPTCLEQGYTTYICDCGDEYVDDDSFEAALGHDWVLEGSDAVTCTEDGFDYFRCSRCGWTKTDIIPATGHDWGDGAVTLPTCTEQGYTTYTCSNCSETKIEDYEAALGHDWDEGTITKQPTETEEGVMTFTCKRCLETRTMPIPVLVHTHKYSASVTDPTCLVQGFTTYICSCGDSYDADYTPALGHDFTSPAGHQDVTCEEIGYTTHKCSRCDVTDTVIIPAIGHNWGEGVVTLPTCTEQGYTTFTCSNCNETRVEDFEAALGHDWNDGIVTKAPTETEEGVMTFTCKRCLETRTSPIPILDHTHIYQESVTGPTCTEQGYTTYACFCGDSYDADYTPALGHEFAIPAGHQDATCEESGYTTHKCSRCDVTDTVIIPATGHDWGAGVATLPTCTEHGYTTFTCSNCSETKIEDYKAALGHNWDDGTVTKAPTETEEGIMTFVCRRCLETRTTPIPALGHTHNYQASVADPTCMEQGFTTYTCSCGDSYVADYTPALGHAFTIPAGHQDATCEESGYSTHKCSRCDVTDTVIIPATGHNWGAGVVTLPTCLEQGYTTYTCLNCSDTKIEDYKAALGHDFSVLVDHKDATPDEDGYDIWKCIRCDETKTVVIPKTGGVTLVSAATAPGSFIGIVETAKNSRIWVLTFNVTLTWSDGTTETVVYSVRLSGNNANLDGKFKFADDHDLAGYTLVYDVKGNGSNIKDFKLICN